MAQPHLGFQGLAGLEANLVNRRPRGDEPVAGQHVVAPPAPGAIPPGGAPVPAAPQFPGVPQLLPANPWQGGAKKRKMRKTRTSSSKKSKKRRTKKQKRRKTKKNQKGGVQPDKSAINAHKNSKLNNHPQQRPHVRFANAPAAPPRLVRRGGRQTSRKTRGKRRR